MRIKTWYLDGIHFKRYESYFWMKVYKMAVLKYRIKETIRLTIHNIKGIKYDDPINIDDLMTVEEFKNLVKCRLLIDYDGFGYAVKNRKENRKSCIKPSFVNLFLKMQPISFGLIDKGLI